MKLDDMKDDYQHINMKEKSDRQHIEDMRNNDMSNEIDTSLY
jgi:hypothetical protein